MKEESSLLALLEEYDLLDLTPNTWEYLNDFKEDYYIYFDNITETIEFLIRICGEYGETFRSQKRSVEMDRIYILLVIKDFFETFYPEEQMADRKKKRDELIEKHTLKI